MRKPLLYINVLYNFKIYDNGMIYMEQLVISQKSGFFAMCRSIFPVAAILG